MSPKTLTGASTFSTIGCSSMIFWHSSANAIICSLLKAKYPFPSNYALHSLGLKRWFKNKENKVSIELICLYILDASFPFFPPYYCFYFSSSRSVSEMCFGFSPAVTSISALPILMRSLCLAKLEMGGVEERETSVEVLLDVLEEFVRLVPLVCWAVLWEPPPMAWSSFYPKSGNG